MRAALVVLLAAATASADPQKDPDTALAISATATLASAGLLAGGIATKNAPMGVIGGASLLVTPSFGHWYAGDGLSAGLAIRGLSVVGGVVLIEVLPCSKSDNPAYECGSSPGAKAWGIFAGIAGVAFGIGVDLATARSAAREHDAKLVPTRVGGGYGLALAGTF